MSYFINIETAYCNSSFSTVKYLLIKMLWKPLKKIKINGSVNTYLKAMTLRLNLEFAHGYVCFLPSLLCLPKHVYKCNLKLRSSRVWEKSAVFSAVVIVTWAFQLFFWFRFTDMVNILYIFNLHCESFLSGAPSRIRQCCFYDEPSCVNAFLWCHMFLVSFPDDSRFIIGHENGKKSYPRLYGETYQY